MNSKITRTLSAAFLMGAAAFAASGLVLSAPAHAAQAGITLEDKELVEAINGAQADAKAGRFAEALAKAKAADARPGKPAALVPQIHKMVVAYAVSAKDFAAALAEIDKMIAANEGNKNENLKQALSIANHDAKQGQGGRICRPVGQQSRPRYAALYCRSDDECRPIQGGPGGGRPSYQGCQPARTGAQIPAGRLFQDERRRSDAARRSNSSCSTIRSWNIGTICCSSPATRRA